MLSQSSERKLKGVHPDLVRVVRRADTMTDDFTVICGVRTLAEQRILKKRGVTTTLNSRHIPGQNGYSHAVDIVPLIHGRQEHVKWAPYYPLAKIIKEAAMLEGVIVEWGGDWKSFKDGPHWQLPYDHYPGTRGT